MKRKIAAVLSCTLALSMCSMPALAASNDTPSRPVVEQLSGVLTAGHPAPVKAEESKPDAEGTLSFGNLKSRMLENNKNLLMLEENIAAVEAIDYDKLADDLRDQLNDTANLQWLNIKYIKDSYTGSTLSQAYDALKDAYDDLKDGKTQKDNADTIKMLKNTENQVLMAGESLYVALQDMTRSEEQLQRQLKSMDRTVQEMELRYSLGQISALQLEQVKSGRTSLVSGINTLQMNIKTCNMQMQMMLGLPLSDNLALGVLPQVTAEQLNAMELDKDLASAKAASYQLLDAQNTLDDAKESFDDAGDEYHHNPSKYQYVAAQHVWQAAQYQYTATVETYEANFRSLYLQVKDYKQVLDAAQVALQLEKSNFNSVQTKYNQGSISYNELLNAQDDVAEAEDKVASAQVNLFSAYNNYRWAVQYGILN